MFIEAEIGWEMGRALCGRTPSKRPLTPPLGWAG